ncbi:MAG: DUF1343 domain-containing protein [Calditrichaeota bacterium]|nr:MAG: DUF1343 domain-containing protein [Calditrichota bacterium]
MPVQTGLDCLIAEEFESLRGKRVGLLCNQASIAGDLTHAVDRFYQAHRRGIIRLMALFGPQHGLWGHTQDNMIEWQGYDDRRLQLPVHSLYGEHRKPTPEMLQGLDVLVVDLQDVGAKYYTFIWTMALCMEACAEQGVEVMVLDRPNPLNGTALEGPACNREFLSFVGLHPLAIRHGMTIGEIARYFREHFYPGVSLTVMTMRGWHREMFFEDTALPWAMPSPNMPTPDTARVYPGMCLLEATNISEGRGTTRPFEMFGAPWIDGWAVAEALRQYDLPGAVFRPLQFQPTFHKYCGEVCGGCFIHLTDREAFQPFKTAIALLREIIRRYPEHFRWKQPPYEYEYEKMPFDILVGNDWLRAMLEEQRPLPEMEARWQEETGWFENLRKAWLLY